MRLRLDSKYQALLSAQRRHPCRRPAASASRTLRGEGIPQVEIGAGREDTRGVHNRADQTQWRQPDLGEGGGAGGRERKDSSAGTWTEFRREHGGVRPWGDLWKQGCKISKINGPIANAKPKGSKE